ncbi:MAG: 4Fe-4S dicluster domain-containing protein, partial [Lutibacter sp.]|nr:4Fe-4S dicluster domain-containing protein [Lutibacter sp.]
MKYGFIIDNRKCIGCHACTTACKSEHDVAIGVNRTYVKQVEKGEFPNTRRIFSVMRCNHCTDAPCVEICPVQALYTREDGIVDFDNNRCIGCKSCMQACPYDALYIDPDTHTAAKCNYCAHRVDVGREPACVSVCPEHAIIAGDMHNPNTEISQLLARQAVKVRKPEKGTNPNLFYIDADDSSLFPEATDRSGPSMWSSQARGVGHFAKAAEKMMYSNKEFDLLQMTIDNDIEAAYQRKDSENPNY